ncbi:MAG: SDR family oxidoreductase [Pseudomonadales bacterium]|jgi:NAD(P)-dependent dehydrogenase (short-subunit alcohol dehydrogenase family)|nr:SDR family oxidoreductase [Pseudomonadales bacterium]MDP6472680.1 SDR family oxidoreductase [Pseudomonadales bacterium]|tara:strand:+ start:222 stop:893 length:672 start_codon:yes stop_codon:yes gene_type:complete
MNLEGKTVAVTGAAGVLGDAVARKAVQCGAKVVLVDVVEGFESGLGPTHSVDLLDKAATSACLSSVGALDAVCNIAGGFDMGPPVYQIDDAMWDGMFDINVRTLRNVLATAVPVLIERGRGSIVNVGALGALHGQVNMGAYTVAKSVVMRLTEALSEEVRGQGINVNAVLPSLIDTPRNRADMPDADYSKWVSPEKLANVVCFLASESASDVHGALVPVTGLV